MNIGEMRALFMDENGKLTDIMKAELNSYIEAEIQKEINKEVIARVMANLKSEDERA